LSYDFSCFEAIVGCRLRAITTRRRREGTDREYAGRKGPG